MPGKGYIFKTVVCGEGKVGKTSLILQYTQHKFSEQYIQTIGSNFAIADVMLPDSKPVKLQLWDLAGQEQFSFVRPPFYKGASAVIFVYDITKRQSLEAIREWKAEVEKYVDESTKYFLIGNKNDLEDERVVTTADGEVMGQELGVVGFWETSAKTGENLPDAFYTIAEAVYSTYEQSGINVGY
ncbi:MAG TPA: Rab family GTPase [Candidatus Lokiarchaeia archaeon]|nr:Rab family GTPase [Candidatus Lokiarchaeia archaeon]